MDSVPVSAPALPTDSLPAAVGELVVHNGRLRGTRRPLASALTLIGRDPLCEFHLNVEGVEPLHCALVQSPLGFLVRDLGSAAGTLVNGERVQEILLHQGDLLSVGPFQFVVHLPESRELASSAALQAERDALRIQAAAVAAQQASLAEEEMQLHQRRKALVRQKEQLAAHLEERRQQLVALREQARQDRAALKTEMEAGRRQNEEVCHALAKERETVQKELQQADKERRRFIELRKRLKKRWRKQWHLHEAALQRREQELKAEYAKIERDAETLRRERVQMTQAQLRFNGEVELGRRQLQDEWQQLGLAQQQWETGLHLEQTERNHRLRECDRRAEGLAATERAIDEQRRAVEQLQLNLRKEAEGLEARIRNQRAKLLEYEKQLSEEARKRTSEPPPAVVVIRPREPEVPRVLARLAGDLADQRRHLVEQWHCLLQMHEAWQPERVALLAQFETAARELVVVEQRLTVREQALASGEADLRCRFQSLFETRASLEAWQARLTARETFLDNERVMLLAEVRAREEMAEAQVRRLEEIRQRRARRRAQEIEELRCARAQHEQMRRDYAVLWQECQDRRAELLREQRDLLGKTLALEQFRQQLLGRAADSPEAEKRLERLRRRHQTCLQAEERDLKRERDALSAETKRLDARAVRLSEREIRLDGRHEDWMQQVADWEERQAASAELEQHRQQELRHWQLLHEQAERQVIELREEVERIARLLLEEVETTTNAPLAA